MRTCPDCGGPVREVFSGSMVGSSRMLYVFMLVIEARAPRQIAANAWMCDTCRIAGGIPPPATPLERAERERQMAEMVRATVPFWRSSV